MCVLIEDLGHVDTEWAHLQLCDVRGDGRAVMLHELLAVHLHHDDDGGEDGDQTLRGYVQVGMQLLSGMSKFTHSIVLISLTLSSLRGS